MTDRMTPEQRHKCMAAVKGKNTKPELLVRKFLFAKGLRYRLHSKKLHGHPDIVFPKYKTAVFIDGCFWHGHEGCCLYKLPSSNREFWERKIRHNVARDISTNSVLEIMGWRVLRVWECELRSVTGRAKRLERLYRDIISGAIRKDSSSFSEEDIAIAAEPEEPYGKEE